MRPSVARSNAHPTPAAGRPAESAAHDHDFAVRLGKFLAVVAANQPRCPLGFGNDRQLHEIGVVDRTVEQSERRRIDHVLGVVQHDQAELAPVPSFVLFEGRIEQVEAVGLRGRAIAVDHDQPHARVVTGSTDDGFRRRRIVAVAADIEAQLGLRPGGQRMGDGEADHPILVPRGDHYRSQPSKCALALLAPVNAPALRAAGQPQPDPDPVDRQFVERADQEEHRGKEQQFTLDERQPFERQQLPHSGFPRETTDSISLQQCRRGQIGKNGLRVKFLKPCPAWVRELSCTGFARHSVPAIC